VSTTKAIAGLLALAAALAAASIVHAHAEYARSEPGAGAVVSESPAQVDIWFTQTLFRRQGVNWIHVTGPGGADVHAGDAQIDDDDRRHMTVALQPDLPAGEYTVTFHTLSADDGDDFESSFTFTLDPQAQATSTPMSAAATPTDLPPTPAPQPSPTPASTGGSGCGAALLPVLGLTAIARRAGRRRYSQ
jgi:methionine-rich copper-binding protein CopC